MTDPFLEFDALSTATHEDEKVNEFQAVLDTALELAPNSNFVHSCQDWLDSKGFLTRRQVEALENISPEETENDRDWGFQE